MRKSYRVKKEAEFQEVFEARQSVANRQFVVYRLERPGQPHFRLVSRSAKRLAMRFIVIGSSVEFGSRSLSSNRFSSKMLIYW